MFKTSIIRRITISSMALIILLVYYLFPVNIAQNKYPETLSYNEINKGVVYLLNKDNLVSRVNVIMNKKNETLEKIKEIISTITINSNKKDYIPNNFYQVIPEGTEIINISLDNKLLKIDFNELLLNTDKIHERKIIETLVYSLTEFEEIDNIMIFVNGEKLEKLPQTNEILPDLLNKDFGVNKTYNFDSIKDTSKTIVYYSCKNNNETYYIPVTFIENNNDEKVEIIIEKLKNSPLYESNLISYLNTNAKITNYEILEQEIKLSFNKYLLDDIKDDKLLEEVKYTLYLSIRDTYNVNKIEFSIEDSQNYSNLVINYLE